MEEGGADTMMLGTLLVLLGGADSGTLEKVVFLGDAVVRFILQRIDEFKGNEVGCAF